MSRVRGGCPALSAGSLLQCEGVTGLAQRGLPPELQVSKDPEGQPPCTCPMEAVFLRPWGPGAHVEGLAESSPGCTVLDGIVKQAAGAFPTQHPAELAPAMAHEGLLWISRQLHL